MHLRFLGLSFLGLTALVAGAQQASADYVISKFTVNQDISVVGAPAGAKSDSVTTVSPNSIGGYRTIIVNRTGPSVTQGRIESDSNLSTPGLFSFSSPAGVSGSTELRFDGNNPNAPINPTGLGTVDITQGGQNTGFLFRVVSDIGAPMTITAYTDATHVSEVTFLIPADLSFNLQEVFIPFSAFTLKTGAAGLADFASVGALSFLIDGSNSPGLDARMEFIVTTPSVPEPSSMILCGIATACFGGLGLRRKFKRTQV